jgi:hypothetical protein
MQFVPGPVVRIDPLPAAFHDQGRGAEELLELAQRLVRVLVNFHRERQALQQVLLPGAPTVRTVEDRDWRAERDSLDRVGRATCVVHGNLDQMPQAARKLRGRDSEHLVIAEE